MSERLDAPLAIAPALTRLARRVDGLERQRQAIEVRALDPHLGGGAALYAFPSALTVEAGGAPTLMWTAPLARVEHPAMFFWIAHSRTAGVTGAIEVRMYGPSGEAATRPSRLVADTDDFHFLLWAHGLSLWRAGGGRVEVWGQRTAPGVLIFLMPGIAMVDPRGSQPGGGAWYDNTLPPTWV